jgi:voltage-gated sodium channel
VIARLRSLLEHPKTEWFIAGLIFVNAVILGLETSSTAMAVAGPVLVALDSTILAVFVVEIAARIVARRLEFFRDPWSLFDFFVVAIALVPATGNLSVLRALRILRVLRLITVIPSLRRVIGGLVAALPGMGSIVALLALVYYVFSVMATKLFGAAFPEWFGTIGASAYSLFQIMTLESWSMGIVRPVMVQFPYAWLFFVPYIVVTTFSVLNLFIGIIVSAMQSEHDKIVEEERLSIAQGAKDERQLMLQEIREIKSELSAVRAALSAKTA